MVRGGPSTKVLVYLPRRLPRKYYALQDYSTRTFGWGGQYYHPSQAPIGL
jgi:hypothetical protein